MNKLIIVSNRLPLQISIENEELNVSPSVGGLATGMKSVHEAYQSQWVGWSGLTEEQIPKGLEKKVEEAVKKEGCVAVPLTEEEMELYYFGFSNKTIWPLFHYFTQFTEFSQENWDAYKAVNQKFADVIIGMVEKGDKVWVHDYQLLLLPKMIKEKCPDVSIGFFLHIPFPSFEVFRILPWRTELLEGMLGSDLIGFHTFDYERHFLSSVRRILGFDGSFNELNVNGRIIKAESFPMGIDYDHFFDAAMDQQRKSIKDRSKIQQELSKYQLMSPEVKLILSIDRLDYTKGIAHRLRAFEHFLKKYPQFLEKVTLVMLAVPSRASVEHYQMMKSEIDELVGRLNGEYSTINWTPIWYFYRSLPFENLIDLYTSCEIALLTPIRDGMNLVAKEYVATRIDQKGVLILSEMAGAAKEMSEALVINPNNNDEIADAIKTAILMPEEEQISRNTLLQDRLKRYNVARWASDFMNSLNKTEELKNRFLAKKLTSKIEEKILEKYKSAKKRIIFLDYDGTLVGFKNKPEDARPDEELYKILDKLSSDSKNELVLISGRDREFFNKWFGDKNFSLIVEHGVWLRKPNEEWKLIEQMETGWMETIRSVMQFYIDRTPGTFLEEKNYSLVWHYRKADPELGKQRANELKDELGSLIANHNLDILEGSKVIEVKNSGINKGRAALTRLKNKEFGFIFGIGDDWTDEFLFKSLPKEAITVKVGIMNTQARYYIESVDESRDLLRKLGDCS
ncbi:MAG: bifunctional alpha,alpha-trehalose-phosphate synthase (UDP-forming)/trehalose-phosphatase [Bacteroidales bacterium]|nr:bifunctional alpha,alpha-trehalose-phosphate synthase (UDP-forming)/trehalose-phosphatase [Bacteroidales bacterium]